jgi:hypothetical protein
MFKIHDTTHNCIYILNMGLLQDPVASKIHDTGAYDLEQAGVKV